MQKVVVTAEYSFERATELVESLACQGFSVTASHAGPLWTIEAARHINERREREAEEAMKAAGILPNVRANRLDAAGGQSGLSE